PRQPKTWLESSRARADAEAAELSVRAASAKEREPTGLKRSWPKRRIGAPRIALCTLNLERAPKVAPTAWRRAQAQLRQHRRGASSGSGHTREAGGERQADDLRAAENQLLDALASRGQLQEQFGVRAGKCWPTRWDDAETAAGLQCEVESGRELSTRGELADARSQLAESAEAKLALDTVSKALDEKDAQLADAQARLLSNEEQRRADALAGLQRCWNQRSARIEASEPSWRPLAAIGSTLWARLAQLRGALKSAIDRHGCSPLRRAPSAGAASADDGGIDWPPWSVWWETPLRFARPPQPLASVNACLDELQSQISGLSANMTEHALAVRSSGPAVARGGGEGGSQWRPCLKEACGKADDALQSGGDDAAESQQTTADKENQYPQSACRPLPSLADLLRMLDLRRRRQLSQNFLLEPRLLNKLAKAAKPLAGCHVLEIGWRAPAASPGSCLGRAPSGWSAWSSTGKIPAVPGESAELCASCRPRLGATLHQRRELLHRRDCSPSVRQDLQADWHSSSLPKIRLVGNLPFNISTPLLMTWLQDIAERRSVWQHGRVPLVLTFQKEFADRAASGHVDPQPRPAPASSLEYSRRCFDISGRAFLAAGKKSMVTSRTAGDGLCRCGSPLIPSLVACMETLFLARSGGDLLIRLFAETGTQPQCTPRELSIAQFSDLWQALSPNVPD
uniref:RADc domain-containing protein n=1 Tax=Macrostomum lignano TaxID=282301 RepID=A0A1I8FNY6_9PLAT